MSRIKIEDLPINQDLSEAEAKGVKAGAVMSGFKLPTGGLTQFSVAKPPPQPVPTGLNFFGFNSLKPIINGARSYEVTENATAGVRG